MTRLAASGALLLALALAGCGGSSDGPEAEPAATDARKATIEIDAASPIEGPSLSTEEREGIADTLALIDSGGPFRHDQDGATFQNREGLLPDEPSGYYREYTVETPGSDDRGARRLVIGEGGETYYTSDHYSSFAPIDPEDFQ